MLLPPALENSRYWSSTTDCESGTVLTEAELDAAYGSGAQFCVAPGVNPNIVKEAAVREMTFIPGVATASEIQQVLTLGCSVLKFFPAGALGGVEMLKALWAPFRHTGV